jgi:Flp pilus assembly protein TadG
MKSVRQVRSAKRRAARTTVQRRKDSGAAAVEFALVLPILLALVFGIIYFGYIFAAQISLNSSARDAARAAVVQPLAGAGFGVKCSAVATAARLSASTIGIAYPGNSIGVTVTSPSGTTCTYASGTAAPAPVASDPDICQAVTGITRATDNQLKIVLTYRANSPVPLVPFSFNDLTARGAFQCEYS